MNDLSGPSQLLQKWSKPVCVQDWLPTLMCNLLNGFFYYFSFNGFNGFFYLLNYIDPPRPTPSHSQPSPPAHPGLGSAKFLEFCGLFCLVIF